MIFHCLLIFIDLNLTFLLMNVMKLIVWYNTLYMFMESGAFNGKMLLARIIENYIIYDCFRSG